MTESQRSNDDALTPEKEKQQVKPPRMYAVAFLNDDFTTMEYVVHALMTHFGHTEERAMQIMLDVHEKGRGIAGVYTKDVAETKALRVETEAMKEEHPLKLEVEPQEEE